MYELREDYKTAFISAITALESYLKEHAITSMVMGLSGGIDSCVTAIIAAAVAEELGTMTIGRSIPIRTNKYDEVQRAAKIGELFCDDFKELVPDADPYNGLDSTLGILVQHMDKDMFWRDNAGSASFEDKVRIGNIKARLRMIILFDLARKHNGIVLSTDNFTELMLGFWTLHGDVGNFGAIQNLWKTEVYGLAEWLASPDNDVVNFGVEMQDAIKACIDANPTDGLGVTDSDLDQLLPGFKGNHRDGYREVDNILISHMNEGGNLDHPVVQRLKATEFKRRDPYNVPRERLFWPYAR